METFGAADETGCASSATQHLNAEQSPQPEVLKVTSAAAEEDDVEEVAIRMMVATSSPAPPLLNKKLLLCRRFKDSGGILRNFNSLPLFVYATSPSTRATSADGVGVSKEAAAAAAVIAVGQNDSYDVVGIMDCLPLGGGNSSSGGSHHYAMAAAAAAAGTVVGPAMPGVVSYQHHLNLVNHHPLNHHSHHHHLLGGGGGNAHSPYSNNYPLHHSNSHHHIHSEQTKSLQELQNEVGALLEFRDLVIETFPDLKHKMASMSSSTTSSAAAVGASGGGGGGASVNASVSGTNTLTGGMSSSSLASRREWEPGIRIKRKMSQKEPSTSTSSTTAPGAVAGGVVPGGSELSSTSLTRSRSNSHSGKKEPKSGENNNGSVVQDSGFSTETSSSKEGHSASSTNGAMTATIAANRLACPESDDELLNLLDVIHRKSNRLREEVEHLQNYERLNLRGGSGGVNEEVTTPHNAAAVESTVTTAAGDSDQALTKSSSGTTTNTAASSSTQSVLTPKTFREHVERLNKEDIKQLRRERDRLLDKLAEMEAETLTGRIKAAKMNDQVEELISVKKDLEEQLKLAMAQKLELSSRVQQLQQQQQLQSKSSSSQSDYSSQRNFLSSATTVLSTGSGASQTAADNSGNSSGGGTVPLQQTPPRRPNTFQPVVIEQQQLPPPSQQEDIHFAFHQSAGSDNSKQQQQPLGRLDGIVSTPSARNAKCRVTDSKRFTAILLETSVIELQRHLLTLTVQNQGLMQKLEQATKSKTHLAKRLDKSKDDVEDLRFQLEEKNIELEGTKAQLRVLESRFNSSTLSSGAATNSYLHSSSQHDYETNRSSASTTLMLSRRGGGIDSNCSSEMRSRTPQSHIVASALSATSTHMPQPTANQISTPSMKAMTHLPMDELQHHSSSTESAHEHELLQQRPQTAGNSNGGGGGAAAIIGRLMSTSVGGVSPFAEQLSPRNGSGNQQQQQTLKKFSVLGGASASKPSKIPLPGSKAAAYFAGKPPTGRASNAGRSPPSANTSHGSTTSNGSSSKSSLSRSTGNLLYSKSPNSLKRADSAQSIRKDNAAAANCTSNSSTFSNTSGRSSNTSSSIPMSTTPYGGGVGGAKSQTSPSACVLQNSPLPKLKRESLTSRVRHLDSLSRVHHAELPAQVMNSGGGGAGSYVVSSTPKPSSIAAQLNSTMRKDLQLSASGTTQQQQQQFSRRTTSPATAASTLTTSTTTTRRFSSAAAMGASGLRAATVGATSPRHSQEQSNNTSVGESGGGGPNGGGGAASDSDSGKQKNSVYFYDKPKYHHHTNSATSRGNVLPSAITTSALFRKPPPPLINDYKQNGDGLPHNISTALMEKSTFRIPVYGYQNPYFNHYQMSSNDDEEVDSYSLAQLDEEQVEENILDKVVEEEEEQVPPYFKDCSFSSANERGSDNLLVTFDYGFSDSIDDQIPDSWRAKDDDDDDSFVKGRAFAIGAEYKNVSLNLRSTAAEFLNDDDDDEVHDDTQIWFYAPYTHRDEEATNVAAAFQVHRMQHQLQPLKNGDGVGVVGFNGDSVMSLISAYTEYNVDETETEMESSDVDVENDDDANDDYDANVGIEELQFYDSIECA